MQANAGGRLSGSAGTQISGKMTTPSELKPAPIKKSPLPGDQFNQFVVGAGAGSDNPRLPTVVNESNVVAATDTILGIAKASEGVFQRVSEWF